MNHDDDEALRFDQRDGTPPELLQALRALQRESPSGARVAAVANKLGPLLDAPLPGVAPIVTATSGSGLVLVALRWLGAACAIGTTAFWVLSSRAPSHPPQAQPRSTAAPVAAELAPPPGPVEPQTSVSSVDLPAQAEPTQPSVLPRHPLARRHGSGSRSASPSTGHTRRTRSARTEGASHQVATAGGASSVSSVAMGEPSSADAEGVAPVASTPVAPPEPRPAVPDEPGRARAKSEVELLLEARKLVKAEPRAALRLLDAHAARFPDGMLAPEREVLAIEALRASGQTAAAEQRLAAFRARDPKSAHLRRLDP